MMTIIDAYDEVYAFGRQGSNRIRIELDLINAHDIARIVRAVADHESVLLFDVETEPDLAEQIVAEEFHAA